MKLELNSILEWTTDSGDSQGIVASPLFEYDFNNYPDDAFIPCYKLKSLRSTRTRHWIEVKVMKKNLKWAGFYSKLEKILNDRMEYNRQRAAQRRQARRRDFDPAAFTRALNNTIKKFNLD